MAALWGYYLCWLVAKRNDRNLMPRGPKTIVNYTIILAVSVFVDGVFIPIGLPFLFILLRNRLWKNRQEMVREKRSGNHNSRAIGPPSSS
jgi:hypothetical protein